MAAADQRPGKLSKLVKSDLDANNIDDFICILKNTVTGENKLLILLDNLKETITVDFPNDVSIKKIQKGKRGGRWFLGNTLTRKGWNNKSYEVRKLEYLASDGLLLNNFVTNENILYLYSSEEKMLNSYSQSD